MKKLLIIHNIATSYYKNIVFNELYKKYKNVEILHLAETENIREWRIDLSDINYPVRILFNGVLEEVSKIKLIFKITKTLRIINPEILYLGGYSDFAYWVSLIYGKLRGYKIIVEMNSNQLLEKKYRIKEILKRVFIKQCDVGLTYSKSSKKYLIHLGMLPERIIIKPNIIDNKWWSKKVINNLTKREKLISKFGFNKKNLIYVGRFTEEKNILFLIDAFVKVKEKTNNKEWGLILVGDGHQKNLIRKTIKEYDINYVYLPGYVQKENLPNLYSMSDIFILPSLKEPWGIVVNEAMASGLAIFASKNVGASDELVCDNINGCIFDPNNINELIKLFNALFLGEIDINKMKLNSERIIKNFNSEGAAENILEALSLVEVE